jgi:hypothetical protein
LSPIGKKLVQEAAFVEVIERTVAVVADGRGGGGKQFSRLVSQLLLFATLAHVGRPGAGQSVEIDTRRIEAAGLEIRHGAHLTLITDARERDDVARFPEVFDLAVDQWCDYFSIDRQRAADWNVIACVIVDQERFRLAGLFPEDLPQFPAGFQVDDRIWLYVQPGDYYTRHLLLHEGTHAFMQHFLGSHGPPWYSEGMAELLALHVWQDGKLTLRHSVRSSEEVPWWGRVKLVRNDRDAGRGLTLAEVMAVPAETFQKVNAYGWAWAACEFLDRNPRFQAAFRALPSVIRLAPGEFNRRFLEALMESGLAMTDIEFQWQVLVDEIDYGYDVPRAAAVVAETTQTGDTSTIRVSAAHGWQETAVKLQAGVACRVSAEGIFTIRNDGQDWPCDAGGVTIEYYRGRPLGQLLAAVRNSDPAAAASLQWQGIGRDGVLVFPQDGVLYLRVNESPTQLQDNEGELRVTVSPLSD